MSRLNEMMNPTNRDILVAQNRTRPYLKPTPVLGYAVINELVEELGDRTRSLRHQTIYHYPC